MPARIESNSKKNGTNSTDVESTNRSTSSPSGGVSGIPKRSNSISCSPSTNITKPGRQKRRRNGSGASVGSSDAQTPSRKCRRNRSSNGNTTQDPPPHSGSELVKNAAEFLVGGSSKVYVDSDSNTDESIKTVVEEVTVADHVRDDISGTQTPRSNDEGNTSENEDEQVVKLPTSSFNVTEVICHCMDATDTSSGPTTTKIQRSLSSAVANGTSNTKSTPSASPPVSCDPSSSSTAPLVSNLPGSKLTAYSTSAAAAAAADGESSSAAVVVGTGANNHSVSLPKSSLSSFCSATSLVDSVLEQSTIQQSQQQQQGTLVHPPPAAATPAPLPPLSSLLPVVNLSDLDTDPQTSFRNRGKRKSTVSVFMAKKRAKVTRRTTNDDDDGQNPTVTTSANDTAEVDNEEENGAAGQEEEEKEPVPEAISHVYPLRSRLRMQREREDWQRRMLEPRTLATLPFELLKQIVSYLGVVDLFALLSVNRRLRAASLEHLRVVKRINFSSGLPFAYLPSKLDDRALKRILACTPEVTHILGFYPRRIYRSVKDNKTGRSGLTQDGILEAFRSCRKLRSVELMDVSLMSLLVNRIPNVKFHGMFRNRPDSWDSEYAVPLPPEQPARPQQSLHPPSPPASHPTPSTSQQPPPQQQQQQTAVTQVQRMIQKSARLARWFEPQSESPQIQGSPCCPQITYLTSSLQRVFVHNAAQPASAAAAASTDNQPTRQQQQAQPQQAQASQSPPATATNTHSFSTVLSYDNLLAFALAAAGIPSGNSSPTQERRGRTASAGLSSHLANAVMLPVGSGADGSPQQPLQGQGQVWPRVRFVSPMPQLDNPPPVIMPLQIVNLTKLDLVSVAITTLPRLDNVKYLHLKWVHFTVPEPFSHFQGMKLQSFVMNNCTCPQRNFRGVRLFAVLARASQLSRLELVSVRFFEGLIEQLVDRQNPPIPCFRGLQRLVLANNWAASHLDAGLLMICSQATLCHLALQLWHTRNDLFESLVAAQVRFYRLESLVLGYQDPYRARLTQTEAQSLPLTDALESSLPYCLLTSRGLALALSLCPRLTSLTLRLAPYVTGIPTTRAIVEASTAAASAILPQGTAAANSQEDNQAIALAVGLAVPSPLPLKSLTLESCPGITLESLEHTLNSGDPFSQLEILVLRDMVPLSRVGALSEAPRMPHQPSRPTEVDYRLLGLLLSLADLLAAKEVAFAPLSPANGIGMGASVRDVAPSPSHHNTIATTSVPVQPFDVFFTLRTHTYLKDLLQLDGSTRPGQGRIRHRLLAPNSISAEWSQPRGVPPPPREAGFVSQATQTCVCGLMEWDFVQRLGEEGLPPSPSQEGAPSTTPQASMQLGGPLAFHPFPVLTQHAALYHYLVQGDFAKRVCATRTFERLRGAPRNYIHALGGPHQECSVCAADFVDSPSQTQGETSLSHRPRTWTARDACVDTSELRCATGPRPRVLTLRSPLGSALSCGVGASLTTLHLERVGISHLRIACAFRLKSLTLENCPALAAILLSTSPSSGRQGDPVPALRRVRVVRCPKFAVYNWLATLAELYPAHDESIHFYFRPFGAYNPEVEKVLWSRAEGAAHVMVSRDISIDRSERDLEATASTLEQRFREVIALVDQFKRAPPDACQRTRRLLHTEEGPFWSLETDMAWIPTGALNPAIEVSLEDPRPPENFDLLPGAMQEKTMKQEDIEETRQQEGVQKLPSVFLRFLEAYRTEYTLCQRGIHMHVQYRDVHGAESVIDGTKYLAWPYTTEYLQTVAPEDDWNVNWEAMFYEAGGDIDGEEFAPGRRRWAGRSELKRRFDGGEGGDVVSKKPRTEDQEHVGEDEICL